MAVRNGLDGLGKTRRFPGDFDDAGRWVMTKCCRDEGQEMTAISGARIVIGRPRRGGRDFFRRYRVIVDGVERGKLGRGQELSIEVTPGVHEVEGRIDWCSSGPLRIDVREGAAVRMTLRPGGSALRVADCVTPVGYLTLAVEG
jgi:hypothetical protein